MQQTVVTAEEASPHIKRMLRTLLPHELDRFEELIESGEMVGRKWGRCIYSLLLKACDYRLQESSDRDAVFEEIRKRVRSRFGVRLRKLNPNTVEIYCFNVRRGETPETSDILALCAVLISEIRTEIQETETLSLSEIEATV
ncbi:hypothetical protein KW796_02830 [Candidatus Parcubacteria bacterium]|nr:hypothetical protein [Candidatus Parcubacteria bacterium]